MTQTIDRAQIQQLMAALAERNIATEYFETGAHAVERLKELVPLGGEVMTGSSTTLDKIGFTGWLKAHHAEGRLRYFRAEVGTFGDPAVRNANRRQASLAPYFLGPVG